MPRYTDPETGKSIFSETPLEENEITEGLGLAKEVKQPLSPWGKWAETQKESLGKAVDIGGRIATGLVPPLSFLNPSWREEYGKAPSQIGLPPGTLTGGEYTPEELARVGGEGKTKESMLGEITGRTLENLALMVPGGPTEEVLKGGVRLVGKTIPPLARTVGKVIPESFKTTAKKVFEGIKGPYSVEEGVTVGLRKGAEKSMGELQNVEKQLYDKAGGLTTKGQKVNFESTTKGLNEFEQTDIFGRLKPPEKAQMRSTINQIRKEISPGARTGKTTLSPQEMEDIIQTGTGEFIQGGGEVRLPGTFTQARATRSWLSEESYKAFQKGDKNLGIAYQNLKNTIEKDLEKSVGTDTWSAWKEADAFKTRKHLMDEIFGQQAEIKPGKYEFAKVKKNIKDIPTQRFEVAGFSKEDINALHQISDVGKFRTYVETHPLLKAIIPIEALNEILGLKLPMPSVTRAGRYILGRAIGI